MSHTREWVTCVLRKYSMASFMRSSATTSRYVICRLQLAVQRVSIDGSTAIASMLWKMAGVFDEGSADVRGNAAVPACVV